MAGRPGKFQPRFTSGVLDPLMAQNSDVEAFNKGLAAGQNIRPLPQGGFTAADGLFKVDRVRGVFALLALAGGPALPLVQTGVGANTVVATYGLAYNLGLTAVDVYDFAGTLPGGAAPTYSQPNPPESPLIAGTISVQYNTGTAWVTLDQVFQWTDTLRTRRFALPAGQTAAATQIRVVVNCTTAGGCTAYIGGVVAWSETTTPSAVKYRPFTYSSQYAYDMIFTQDGAEVYRNNVRVASIPLGASAAQVLETKATQELATMVLTHQIGAPLEILRQGSDYEWQIQQVQFTALPIYDFGDVVYTNATPSQWELTFVNFDAALSGTTPPLPTGGCHYTIAVNGTPSTAIQQPSSGSFSAGNWSGTAAAIKAAILSLPGVPPGVTVTMTQNTSQFSTFLVTMAGPGNEGNGWAISGTVLDKADAAITSQQYQVGVLGGEPILSPARGYPAACCIAQQRLLLGGFPLAPLAIIASEIGDPTNFNTRLTAAASPFLLQIDGQGNETVLDIHLGRTIIVFTTLGEYWFQPGALSATTAPTVTYSTSNGIARTVEPIETEDVTVFCHASGGLLLEYFYEYQFQNFSAKPISTQASSLVQGIVDNALQRATEGVDTNRHWLVLSDGTAVVRATMRTEEINAYAPRVTDGRFVSVGANAAAEACWVVQRQVAGQPVNFFEKALPGLWLDGAEYFNVAEGQASISGLTDFIGASVWAIVDGYAQGPFVVSPFGWIALEFAALAAGTAIVGRWIAPLAETLPLPRTVGERTVVRRPGRAHTVRLSLVDTTNVAISANGSPVYDCPLYRFGGLADTPPSAQPYSGWAKLEGLPGYKEDVQVTITQTRPGALTVTGVVIEADL